MKIPPVTEYPRLCTRDIVFVRVSRYQFYTGDPNISPHSISDSSRAWIGEFFVRTGKISLTDDNDNLNSYQAQIITNTLK